KNEMAPAGINLKIISVDPGSLLTNFYEHKQYQAITIPYPAEEEYARQLYDSYGAKGFTAALTGSVQGGQFEQLLIQGQARPDPAQADHAAGRRPRDQPSPRGAHRLHGPDDGLEGLQDRGHARAGRRPLPAGVHRVLR